MNKKCPTCNEEMDDYHVPALCRIAELEAELRGSVPIAFQQRTMAENAELEAEVAKLQGLLATTKQHLSKLREAILKHLRNSNLASREELRRVAFTNYWEKG